MSHPTLPTLVAQTIFTGDANIPSVTVARGDQDLVIVNSSSHYPNGTICTFSVETKPGTALKLELLPKTILGTANDATTYVNTSSATFPTNGNVLSISAPDAMADGSTIVLSLERTSVGVNHSEYSLKWNVSQSVAFEKFGLFQIRLTAVAANDTPTTITLPGYVGVVPSVDTFDIDIGVQDMTVLKTHTTAVPFEENITINVKDNLGFSQDIKNKLKNSVQFSHYQAFVAAQVSQPVFSLELGESNYFAALAGARADKGAFSVSTDTLEIAPTAATTTTKPGTDVVHAALYQCSSQGLSTDIIQRMAGASIEGAVADAYVAHAEIVGNELFVVTKHEGGDAWTPGSANKKFILSPFHAQNSVSTLKTFSYLPDAKSYAENADLLPMVLQHRISVVSSAQQENVTKLSGSITVYPPARIDFPALTDANDTANSSNLFILYTKNLPTGATVSNGVDLTGETFTTTFVLPRPEADLNNLVGRYSTPTSVDIVSMTNEKTTGKLTAEFDTNGHVKLTLTELTVGNLDTANYAIMGQHATAEKSSYNNLDLRYPNLKSADAPTNCNLGVYLNTNGAHANGTLVVGGTSTENVVEVATVKGCRNDNVVVAVDGIMAFTKTGERTKNKVTLSHANLVGGWLPTNGVLSQPDNATTTSADIESTQDNGDGTTTITLKDNYVGTFNTTNGIRSNGVLGKVETIDVVRTDQLAPTVGMSFDDGNGATGTISGVNNNTLTVKDLSQHLQTGGHPKIDGYSLDLHTIDYYARASEAPEVGDTVVQASAGVELGKICKVVSSDDTTNGGKNYRVAVQVKKFYDGATAFDTNEGTGRLTIGGNTISADQQLTLDAPTKHLLAKNDGTYQIGIDTTLNGGPATVKKVRVKFTTAPIAFTEALAAGTAVSQATTNATGVLHSEISNGNQTEFTVSVDNNSPGVFDVSNAITIGTVPIAGTALTNAKTIVWVESSNFAQNDTITSVPSITEIQVDIGPYIDLPAQNSTPSAGLGYVVAVEGQKLYLRGGTDTLANGQNIPSGIDSVTKLTFQDASQITASGQVTQGLVSGTVSGKDGNDVYVKNMNGAFTTTNNVILNNSPSNTKLLTLSTADMTNATVTVGTPVTQETTGATGTVHSLTNTGIYVNQIVLTGVSNTFNTTDRIQGSVATASLTFQNASSWGSNMTKASVSITIDNAPVNDGDPFILYFGQKTATVSSADAAGKTKTQFAELLRDATVEGIDIGGTGDIVTFTTKQQDGANFNVQANGNMQQVSSINSGDEKNTSGGTASGYTMTSYAPGTTHTVTLKVGTEEKGFQISKSGQGGSGSQSESALATAVATWFNTHTGGVIVSAIPDGDDNKKVNFTGLASGANFTVTVTDAGGIDAVLEPTSTTDNGASIIIPTDVGNGPAIYTPSAAVVRAPKVNGNGLTLHQLSVQSVDVVSGYPYQVSTITGPVGESAVVASETTLVNVSHGERGPFQIRPVDAGNNPVANNTYLGTSRGLLDDQPLRFSIDYGSVVEQIAAVRFRANVTVGNDLAETFAVNLETLNLPTFYPMKYLKTDGTNNWSFASASVDANGNVVSGGATLTKDDDLVMRQTKWVMYREKSLWGQVQLATHGLVQLDTRYGGDQNLYLPTLESKCLWYDANTDNTFTFKLKEPSGYDMKTADGSAFVAVSADITNLFPAGATFKVGTGDTVTVASASVSAGGKLVITTQETLSTVVGAYTGRLQESNDAGTSFKPRFSLETSAQQIVGRQHPGPYIVRPVTSAWAGSDSYTEKVLLVYRDGVDAKSYVVDDYTVGLRVINDDDTTANNYNIQSKTDSELFIFREDIVGSAGKIPIIYASATKGIEMYQLRLNITSAVWSGGGGTAVKDTMITSQDSGNTQNVQLNTPALDGIVQTASISIQNVVSFPDISHTEETITVVYQPKQVINAPSGWIIENGGNEDIGGPLTTVVTIRPTVLEDSLPQLPDAHVWDTVETNQVLTSKPYTHTFDIALLSTKLNDVDDTGGVGNAMALNILSPVGANKTLELKNNAAWTDVDSGESANDKNVRSVDYCITKSDSDFYQNDASRMITGVEAVAGGVVRYYMNTTFGLAQDSTVTGTLEYDNAANTTYTLTVKDGYVEQAADATPSITTATMQTGKHVAGSHFTFKSGAVARLFTNSKKTVNVHVYRSAKFDLADKITTGQKTTSAATKPRRVIHKSIAAPTDLQLTYAQTMTAAPAIGNSAGMAYASPNFTFNPADRSDAVVDYETPVQTITVTNTNALASAYTNSGGTITGPTIVGTDERTTCVRSIEILMIPDPSLSAKAKATIHAFESQFAANGTCGNYEGNYYHSTLDPTVIEKVTSAEFESATIRAPHAFNGPARYVPTSNVILGAQVEAPDETTATFIWSKAGEAFQINLERNSTAVAPYPSKVVDNSEHPATDSIEYWNGDRSINGSHMDDGNWIDGHLYELKINTVGGLNISTYTGDLANPTITPGTANTQWTITGYTQTVLQGTVEYDAGTDKTRLVVKLGANGLPEYRPWGTTELVAYSFTGTVADLTADTVLVAERLTTKSTSTGGAIVATPLTTPNVMLQSAAMVPLGTANIAAEFPLGTANTWAVKHTDTPSGAALPGITTARLVSSKEATLSMTIIREQNPSVAQTGVGNTNATGAVVLTITDATAVAVGHVVWQSKIRQDDTHASYTSAKGTVASIDGDLLTMTVESGTFETSATYNNFGTFAMAARYNGATPDATYTTIEPSPGNQYDTGIAVSEVSGGSVTLNETTTTLADKMTFQFTPYTGTGFGVTDTANYEAKYVVNYANDHAIYTNAGSATPRVAVDLASGITGFDAVKENNSTYRLGIASDATIPDDLDNSEDHLKISFAFASDNLSGEGEHTFSLEGGAKLSTTVHPSVRFNHRGAGANDGTRQSADQITDKPWLYYHASTLSGNADFADFELANTGSTIAVTEGTGTLGVNVSSTYPPPPPRNEFWTEGNLNQTGDSATVNPNIVLSVKTQAQNADLDFGGSDNWTNGFLVYRTYMYNAGTWTQIDAGNYQNNTDYRGGTMITSGSWISEWNYKDVQDKTQASPLKMTQVYGQSNGTEITSTYYWDPATQSFGYDDPTANDPTANDPKALNTNGNALPAGTRKTDVIVTASMGAYNGPNGLAQDMDGIQLTVQADPAIDVFNRRKAVYRSDCTEDGTLADNMIYTLRDGLDQTGGVHPIGEYAATKFDVGAADGTSSDVVIRFTNINCFKGVGHANFSDTWAIAPLEANKDTQHFRSTGDNQVGFYSRSGGTAAISATGSQNTIPTADVAFLDSASFSIKKLARDPSTNALALATDGETLVDMDAKGDAAFIVQGGVRKTGAEKDGALNQTEGTFTIDTETTSAYTLTEAAGMLGTTIDYSADATLIVPPQLAYKSGSNTTGTTGIVAGTNEFELTYTQQGSKLLANDSAYTSSAKSTTLQIEILKDLKETIHVADQASSSSQTAGAPTEHFVMEGGELKDNTKRNYFYSQKLYDDATPRLLCTYFNQDDDLGTSTGTRNVTGYRNLKNVALNSGGDRFALQKYTMGANNTGCIQAFGASLMSAAANTAFKEGAQYEKKQFDLSFTLTPNGYSRESSTLVLRVGKSNEDGEAIRLHKGVLSETVSGAQATATDDIDKVLTYDGTQWQTVSADSTTTAQTLADADLSSEWASNGAAGFSAFTQYDNVPSGGAIYNGTDRSGIVNTIKIRQTSKITRTGSTITSSATWTDKTGLSSSGSNVEANVYASSAKVNGMTAPNWSGTSPDRTMGISFATTGGTFNLPFVSTTSTAFGPQTDTQAADTDTANTVTFTNAGYKTDITVQMTNGKKFSVSRKPSLARQTAPTNDQGATIKRITNGASNEDLESFKDCVGNMMVVHTDMRDLRNPTDGTKQLTEMEHRITVLVDTGTTDGVSRYNDTNTGAIRTFTLTRTGTTATLQLTTTANDNFYFPLYGTKLTVEGGATTDDIQAGDEVKQKNGDVHSYGKVLNVDTAGRVTVRYAGWSGSGDTRGFTQPTAAAAIAPIKFQQNTNSVTFSRGGNTVATKTITAILDLGVSATGRRLTTMTAYGGQNGTGVDQNGTGKSYAIYAEHEQHIKTDLTIASANDNMTITEVGAVSTYEHDTLGHVKNYTEHALQSVDLASMPVYTGNREYTFTVQNALLNGGDFKYKDDMQIGQGFIARKNTEGDMVFLWRITKYTGAVITATLIGGNDHTGKRLEPSELKLTGAASQGTNTRQTVPLQDGYYFMSMEPVDVNQRTALPVHPYGRDVTINSFNLTDASTGMIIDLTTATDSVLDNIEGTPSANIVPDIYIVRRKDALPTYAMAFNNVTKKLTLTGASKTMSGTIPLAAGNRYFVAPMDKSAYIGYYKYSTGGVFTWEDHRTTPQSYTEPPTEDGTTNKTAVMILPGNALKDAETLSINDDMKEDVDKVTQILRDDTIRTTANTFRLRDLPTRITQRDVLVVVLRKEKPDAYDDLLDDDRIQCQQLTGGSSLVQWGKNNNPTSNPNKDGILFTQLPLDTNVLPLDDVLGKNQLHGVDFMSSDHSLRLLHYMRTRQKYAADPVLNGDNIDYSIVNSLGFAPYGETNRECVIVFDA